ncbi:hypothetical protein Ping_2665 [Psychromonas ingrahamii 37]|uniref:Transposase IS200-like domain-containing protein n=1 Tax=Psychromonas ingrahamii (strain DSM 17664 / CCUG 51855 / 37) TaxID=357804 RepID=A1SY13_PSYIN|nr:hypothetical protein Ping_2665 [Psychromonas ingrahamii 37]
MVAIRFLRFSIIFFVTKYRYQVLQGVISKDHVHFLVSAPPNMAPSEIMRRVKGRSS